MEAGEQLSQIEAMCERLYTAQDPQERSHAEQVLKVFSNSPDYAGQCQSILDNSSSPYAQHLAASSLLKMVTDQVVSQQMKLNIRDYLLNYLFTKGPGGEPADEAEHPGLP